MRRLIAIACGVAGAAALLVFGTASGGDIGSYEVRAIFDNGGFVVSGEEVRIAGARVGQVSDVDVSGVDENVSRKGGPAPGKAVVVLRIEDPAFRDFRQDASCMIRPQSLLGEKFVECSATRPRAPGSEPPPPLERIPDGQPGAGQHLLPLESNGKAVDLDLVQNISRAPAADQFRLILNDLGAGLAARGEDLGEIVERSNPALKETDEVLKILAEQKRGLAKLASDGDAILEPLAREREHVSGFISSAGATARATAERGPELEAGLRRFPGALRELRRTSTELGGFADQAAPVTSDLGDAAPSLNRATRALGPFADGARTALIDLGNAADASRQDLVDSDPVVVDIRDLARETEPAAEDLKTLLSSLRESQGFERLMDFIFYTVGSVNGFDQFGHFLRAEVLVTNCVNYEIVPTSGCEGNFRGTATQALTLSDLPRLRREAVRVAAAKKERRSGSARTSGGAGADLLEYLMGDGQ